MVRWSPRLSTAQRVEKGQHPERLSGTDANDALSAAEHDGSHDFGLKIMASPAWLHELRVPVQPQPDQSSPLRFSSQYAFTRVGLPESSSAWSVWRILAIDCALPVRHSQLFAWVRSAVAVAAVSRPR